MKTPAKKSKAKKMKKTTSADLMRALKELGHTIDLRMAELESVRVEKAQLEKQLDDSVTLHNENIAEMNKLRREFYDLRDHGIRFDLTPTTILSPGRTSDGTPDGTYTFKQVAEFSQRVHGFYQEYLKRIDESIRDRARIALGEDPLHTTKPGTVMTAKAVRREQLTNEVDQMLEGTGVFVDREKTRQLDPVTWQRPFTPSDNMDEPPRDVPIYERIARVVSTKEPGRFLTGHGAIDLWREVREAKGNLNIECPESDDELYKLIKPFLG